MSGLHPAQYSPEILEVVESVMREMAPEGIHDPFAGPGLRLAKLCDAVGVPFTGTDIEDWPGHDPRVQVGDARDPGTYPSSEFVVVTSPVYLNKRFGDYANGPTPRTKTKGRRDYGIALGRALHPDNFARLTGRPGHADGYWQRHRECIQHWGDRVVLNVDGPIADGWTGLLVEFGYRIVETHVANTRRYRGLANADVRADHEVVLVGHRSDAPALTVPQWQEWRRQPELEGAPDGGAPLAQRAALCGDYRAAGSDEERTEIMRALVELHGGDDQAVARVGTRVTEDPAPPDGSSKRSSHEEGTRMTRRSDLSSDEAGTWDPINQASHYARNGLKVVSLIGKRPWQLGWPDLGSSNISEVVQDFDEAIRRAGSPEKVWVGWVLGRRYVALDIDEPDLAGPELRAVLDAGGYAVNQTSKPGRFHAVYLVPDGMVVGNSAGKFPERGWGEVRGFHGQIVIAGPDRPGFDASELVKATPFPRPDWLTEYTETGAGATDSQVAEFLVHHTSNEAPRRLETILRYAADETWRASRHDRSMDALGWAMRDARIGLIPAAEAVKRLHDLFLDSVGEDTERTRQRPRPEQEFAKLVARAVGLANEMTEKDLFDRKWYAIEAGSIPLPIGGDTPVREPDSPDTETEDDVHGYVAVDLGPYLEGKAVQVKADLVVMSDGRALLHRERLNGLHGDSGAGKSWFVAFGVREVVKAGVAVMVIDLEDTPIPLIERLRQIGVADSQIKDHVVFVRPQEPFIEENVNRLIRLVGDRQVAHIFIETLGEAFSLEGLNEDRDVEVAPWLRRVCRRIIERTGVGITLIDHGTKSAERPLDPSGSKRKRAAITGTGWLMQAIDPFDRSGGGVAVLTCAKDRHGWFKRGEAVARLIMGPLDPISRQTSLRLDPAPSPLGVASSPDVGPVVQVLAGVHPRALSQNELIAEVRNAGHLWGDRRIRRAAEQAVARSLVRESPGPNRTRLYEVIMPPSPGA